MIRARPWILGEVLFDRFADGTEVLGGAPFNVAWHLQGLGARPLFISRVGDDAAGARALAAMRSWGLDTAFVQVDAAHATGSVQVEVRDGEPHYVIDPFQAYGHLETPLLPPPGSNGLLYHGTLAAWSEGTRRTLDEIQRQTRLPVFMDVNLRAPWWRRETLSGWLERATWVKLNLDELERLEPGQGSPAEVAARFRSRLGLRHVVLTLGEQGALAVDSRGNCRAVGAVHDTKVVDTVGAGDAFAAVMILGELAGWDLDESLARAGALAGAVCGLRGATTTDHSFYHRFLQDWSLT